MPIDRRIFLLGAVALSAAPNIGRALANAQMEHVVEIKAFKFVPEQLNLNIGDVVVWRNLDVVPHTVTALDESWTSGTIARGEEFTQKVMPKMVMAYYCAFHPHMKAKMEIAP